MKRLFFLLVAISVWFVGCKTPVNLADYKQSAETSADAGDYLIATEAYRAYFAQFSADNEPEVTEYARAAQIAFQANEAEQALEWYEYARRKGYDDPSMYQTIAEIYQHQGNVSNELAALENYIERSAEVDRDAYARLFSIYYEANQKQKALETWNKMPDTVKRTGENLDRYFTLNKQLDNVTVVDSVSMALLEVTPGHVGALEWQAQKSYEKGEARYQKEMKAYEARPTTGNYQTLLRGLKAASVHFKESLQYFEKLWEVNPDDRNQYAVYMNNIHVRFNDKEKADYYRKFIN